MLKKFLLDQRFFLVKSLLFLCGVVLGNVFLSFFVDSLEGGHLLTNSPFEVILSFLFPIILFSLFLTVILYYSVFVKKKYLWLLLCLSSFASYPFFLKFSLFSVAGGLGIALALYFFLLGFHEFKILINNRSSVLGQLSMSLMGSTIVISILIAFNFYSFYKNILSQSNIVLSEKVIESSLSPVIKVYLNDLDIKDINESYGDYIKREARLTRQTQSKVEQETLSRLSLTQADQRSTMAKLLNESLNNSVLKVITEYQKRLPLLISLGLAIITQTMMTAASFLAGVWMIVLLEIFEKLKLISLKSGSHPYKTVESLE